MSHVDFNKHPICVTYFYPHVARLHVTVKCRGQEPTHCHNEDILKT